MPNFNDFYIKLVEIQRPNYTVVYYAEKSLRSLSTITRIITFYENNNQLTVHHRLSVPQAIADYILRALYLK